MGKKYGKFIKIGIIFGLCSAGLATAIDYFTEREIEPLAYLITFVFFSLYTGITFYEVKQKKQRSNQARDEA